MARKAVFIALILVLALSGQALAQKKTDKAPTSLASQPSAAAAGPGTIKDFGNRWNAMGDKERTAFLEGMVSGFRIVCLNVVMAGQSAPPSAQEAEKKFKECVLPMFPYAIREVKEAMNSLYQDKANNVVPFDMMYGMALLKVKGDPALDDSLVSLRKNLAGSK